MLLAWPNSQLAALGVPPQIISHTLSTRRSLCVVGVGSVEALALLLHRWSVTTHAAPHASRACRQRQGVGERRS